MQNYDAIIIPGGGVRTGGELPLWVKRRLDRALEIQNSGYLITLSAGTTYKPPPLDDQGFPIFESVAGANYLVKQGISSHRILTETCSYDTIGNAYFSRVIHVDPLRLTKLLIITSEFHMPRTETIFRWVYSMNAPDRGYDLHFESVSDEGLETDSITARRLKEQESLAKLSILKERFTTNTLDELHKFLFSEHDAYATGSFPERQKARTINKVLDTY